MRGPATRWLRVHAEYDDTHPWEALDIIATLLGNAPPPAEIEAVRRAIRTSYGYIEMGLDDSLSVALHGTFDETASNSSTLGALDAA
jgi:pyrroloquinoline quinone (PQQ) biosynthesis protein C